MSACPYWRFFYYASLHGRRHPKSERNGPGGIAVLFAVLMLVVWLFAILVLTERKSGYMTSLIVSLLNSLILLGHLTGMAGEATPGEILTSSEPFFVWVVLALALTVFPSLVL